MANRLARETSPYLLQHAENPVDWYPWGEEAFARAREEDRAVLVSIGYSACHWCHVMERESFEDERIAQLMNERFVCIKVDREEHPDVDAIYMDAVQAMTGQGGWPLNAFLTPDAVPFWAGTYFPPEARQGMPAWPQVLAAIGAAWDEQREEIRSQAGGIVERLRGAAALKPPEEEIDPASLDAAVAGLRKLYDAEHGGFGTAPKFPPTSAIEFLLGRGEREMALHTLRRMASGGMYDQVGGGFARYSVDRFWLVPALREDALRQRPARPRLPARLAGHRRAAVRARLPRDARLGAGRTAPGGGRLRLRARRRRRGRRGQVHGLDARAGARGPRRRAGRGGDRALRDDRGRQLRGQATSPCARRPTLRTASSCARGSTRRGRSACGRGSTTSA